MSSSQGGSEKGTLHASSPRGKSSEVLALETELDVALKSTAHCVMC